MLIYLALTCWIYCVGGLRDSSADGTNIAPIAIDALHDFYLSLDGPNWRWNAPYAGNVWNFTNANPNPCVDDWEGITCSSVTSPGSYRYVSLLILVGFGLRGSIPSSIITFVELQDLSLSDNQISGTIPNCIGNLTSLITLNLNKNNLEGRIPDALENLRNVESLNLDFNVLSGTIPSNLGNLSSLTNLYIGGNHLDGMIPSELGSLKSLVSLDLSHNQLTGTIPLELFDLTNLLALYLNQNNLQGTIAADVGQLKQLQIVAAFYNHLSGRIPSVLGSMPFLHYIYLDNNFLTGSIPPSIGNLEDLLYLTVNNNKLDGTLPASLSGLKSLQVLLLYNNHLSGQLTEVFDAEVQIQLQTVQINGNRFTGTLPVTLFQLPALNSLVAVGNCLNSYIPSEACKSPNYNLESIVLDGLNSAPACRNSIFPHMDGSAYIIREAKNKWPACLLSLPNLTTLHLSGNGYTGSLPANVVISPKLVDLSLSHNRLTGKIPATFQERIWYNLDLSYNRLGGSLTGAFGSQMVNLDYFKAAQVVHTIISFFNESNMPPDFNLTDLHFLSPSISLEDNRLSGKIPSNLLHLRDVSILGSNVFSCNLDRSNLPSHDNGKSNYQCGSDSFNIPYYTWMGLCAVVLATVAYLCCNTRTIPIVENVRRWYSFEHQKIKTGLFIFNQMMDAVSGVTRKCLEYTIVIMLPLYAVLHTFCGQLVHSYAWVVSAAYLSSTIAAALEMLSLIVAMLLFLVTFVILIRQITQDPMCSTTMESVIAKRRFSFNYKFVYYTLLVIVNIIVVVGFNAAYVYVAIYENTIWLIIAQVLLSIFKIAWNGLCTSSVIRSRILLTHSSLNKNVQSETEFAALQIFLIILNMVVIPCLVVAAISPSCFYNVFIAAPTVSTPYTYRLCYYTDSTGECTVYAPTISEASYKPPFVYNYQCSSSLVTYYSPTYVVLCIVRSVVTPIVQLGVFYLHQRAKEGTRWYLLLDRLLYPFLKNPAALSLMEASNQSESGRDDYFDATRVLITMISYLGLLLTFGMVFPPLAVTLAVTVFVIALTTKLGVGRLLSLVSSFNRFDILDKIENDCRVVASVSLLHTTMWMLITVSCWFYTLFIFDTLGDVVGFHSSFWVLIVMPLMPLIIYGVFNCWQFSALNRGHTIPVVRNPSEKLNSNLPGGELVPIDRTTFHLTEADNPLRASRTSVLELSIVCSNPSAVVKQVVTDEI